MSDENTTRSPGSRVEVYDLWSIAYRETETDPWAVLGTEKKDAAAVLRTYDFWEKNHADVHTCILRTQVVVDVADPDQLRASLAQKRTPEAGPDLQCG